MDKVRYKIPASASQTNIYIKESLLDLKTRCNTLYFRHFRIYHIWPPIWLRLFAVKGMVPKNYLWSGFLSFASLGGCGWWHQSSLSTIFKASYKSLHGYLDERCSNKVWVSSERSILWFRFRWLVTWRRIVPITPRCSHIWTSSSHR